MEINEKNQALYHKAFVSEEGWTHWQPSINEGEIEEWSGNSDGKYTPATPLGFRNYSEGRLDGLKSILDQEPDVTMTLDELKGCIRGKEPFKIYDHLYVSDRDEHFVIVGYDKHVTTATYLLVVTGDNHLYSVDIKSENDDVE